MTRNLLLAVIIAGPQTSGVLIALLITRSHHGLGPDMIALGTAAAAAVSLLVAAVILTKDAAPRRATGRHPGQPANRHDCQEIDRSCP